LLPPFRQLAGLFFDFFLVRLHPAFQLFDVFFRREALRFDSTLAQHVTNDLIVLDMLTGYRRLTIKIDPLFYNIMVISMLKKEGK
jgi:hypothetical protein